MLGRLARTYYRLVGIVFALFGGWLFYLNVAQVSYSGWVLIWILTAGIAGAAGGVLFLLSLDGPDSLRSSRVRLIGWLGMVYCALLPWSFSFVMVPMVLLALASVTGDRPSSGTAAA